MGNVASAVENGSHSNRLEIRLFGPGMTVFHKVGLAGLWMTLEALESDAAASKRLKAAGGDWERDKHSVTFSWEEDPTEFFKTLLRESFRIDDQGLFWFPAHGEPINNPRHAAIMQETLLGTFLQHGQTRTADKPNSPTGALVLQDEGVVLRYRRVKKYAHREAPFTPTGINALAGWLFPGGVVRHTGLTKRSALEEPPGNALALRYLPVGALFFEVRQRREGVRPRYSVVLPQIRDLKQYALIRRHFLRGGARRYVTSGSLEAGFRVLAETKAQGLLEDLAASSCRVLAFGTVPWSKQQKTRVEVFTVAVRSERDLSVFRLCDQLFQPRRVTPGTGDPFWDVPQVPDLITRNLNSGREWWLGLADFLKDQRRRDHVLGYWRSNGKLKIGIGEKGGLAKMVENKEGLPDGAERVFVEACHEAWRRRLGQLGERASREGTSFQDLVQREFERQRITFARCKNASGLMDAVTDFWARAGGPLGPLQGSWQQVLPLLDEHNWRKGRDLSLLAMASYQPRGEAEEVALAALDANMTEGEV